MHAEHISIQYSTDFTYFSNPFSPLTGLHSQFTKYLCRHLLLSQFINLQTAHLPVCGCVIESKDTLIKC